MVLRFRQHAVEPLDFGHQLRVVEVAAVQVEETLADAVAQHKARAPPVLPNRLLRRLGHAQFRAVASDRGPIRVGLVHRIVAERDRIVVVVPELAVHAAADVTGARA